MPFEQSEVETTIASCIDNKAPGVNGFLVGMIKKLMALHAK